MNIFKSAPYYDDFDENNKFYRILFRPGYAVQARELTQIQTIIQNQIRCQGDHIFKEGAMVIPGQMSIDTNADYVRIYSTNTDISNFEGTTVEGSSGITAVVIKVVPVEESDLATLYVKYNKSADDNETKVFAANEVLTTDIGTATVNATDPTGIGSIAMIERGVYYIKSNFVYVNSQSIVLEKYSSVATYRVGLEATESIIIPEENDTLLDNAQGSYNYAAPGAHRYYIDLALTKKDINSEDDENFIELLQVENGVIKRHVTATQYSELEKTFARRTYDESGNYTVTPFVIDIREHRNNNCGSWTTNTSYLIGDVVTYGSNTYVARTAGISGSTAPAHTAYVVSDGTVQWEYNMSPVYNRGVFSAAVNGDESKLAIGLSPGKAYVQGYEIEKIATEYVEIDKSRDYMQVDNAVIPSTVGNYIFITNLNNLPPIGTFGTVTLLKDMTVTLGVAAGLNVGSARVRLIEWDNGTIGTQTAIYKLSLFDIQMTSGHDFNRDVKSVYYNVSSDPNLSFTANISPVLTRLVGSVSASSSTTVTGVGTSFVTDLIVGDYVSLGGVVRKVNVITNQNSMVVNTATSVTGSTVDRISTAIVEPQNSSLVFPVSNYAVKSARSSSNTNDTSYTVYQRFTASVGLSPYTITIGPLATGSTFASSAASDNYIIVDNDATNGGAVINPISIVPSGTNCTITVASAYSGRSVIVIAAVNRSGTASTEKTKTLVLATPANNSAGKTQVTKTTAQTGAASTIFLAKADGYRLLSVKMDTGTFASPTGVYTIDITDRYDFDNGQRDAYYDLARIMLKSSYTRPVAPVRITFEYFDHGNGDYFTVNSYNINYKDIPVYGGIPLRNCVDFRPRISDTGTSFSVLSLIPKRGVDVRVDYQYYQSRKTKIILSLDGTFTVNNGVSSIIPGDPQDPSLGMVLYNLYLQPFTFDTTTNQVVPGLIDNKRYTMRDIGRLEKRIDNLEYYTSLSLLEQQTESLDIVDSDGNNRFKNGFIVDGFSGHNTGNVASLDYMCSIDMENSELRPFFSMNNVNLIENTSSDTTRGIRNYKLYGDVITLPVIDDIVLVNQPYASRTENINPFATFTFLGSVNINPSSDDWFDIQRLPDIVNDIEGNFNTLNILAQKANALGTVWNAWQTQWTGTPWVAATWQTVERGGGIRRVGWETDAMLVGQSRTGTKTSIVAKIDRQVVGDRIISTAVIPFIRSRNILIQVKGLKPNTKFYPFFDDLDISSYCTPASQIEYTVTNGVFDCITNIGSDTSEPARRVNGDLQVCLNCGDVVYTAVRGVTTYTQLTSVATAVVVGKSYDAIANTYYLQISNIKGSFLASDTIKGSVSGAIGTATNIDIKTLNGAIVSNFNGEVELLFNIPNNDAIHFRTGTHELKLIDNSLAQGEFTSRGRGTYRARGVLETHQQTVNAVRNADLVQSMVSDTQTIIQTNTFRAWTGGWYDPLAQSFLVQSNGGAFLSKIDIFFATKDNNIPVSLEIRECVNGFPGKNVLPFSKVTLNPNQINLSSINVLSDDVSYPKYDTSTTFIFPSPVYVQDNQEYAIVLTSDSNNYRVWISQIGDQIPDSNRTISEQPYLGSLFKSQNASTWTADQTQDLKFTIYRAQFDVNATSDVEFVNGPVPYQLLGIDPFEIRLGSTKVRVWQTDHGMPAGSSVVITNITPVNICGIPYTEIYTTHIISDVDVDSYCINVTTTPTSTNYGGGITVKASKNIQFDCVQPIIQVQTFPETTTDFKFKSIAGSTPDSSQVPYGDLDLIGYDNVLANDNNYFYTPRMIAAEVNGDKSSIISVAMTTTNDAVSPIIDTDRTSLILVSNKVNWPTETNTNVTGVDYNVLLTGSAAIAVSGNQISASDAASQNAFAQIQIGKYITVDNITTSQSGTYLVVINTGSTITFATTPIAITITLGDVVNITQREKYVDDISPVGSSTFSKYVTKRINLDTPSTYIRIRMAAAIPPESMINVYYKTSPVGSTISLDSVNYTLLTPDSPIQYVQDGSSLFIDMTYSAIDVAVFDAIQVKITMKSTNSSAVPRVKDLRIIACA